MVGFHEKNILIMKKETTIVILPKAINLGNVADLNNKQIIEKVSALVQPIVVN